MLLYERYLSERRNLGVSVIKRGQKEGAVTSTKPAELLYDQIYGTIFYRFLFHLPGLNQRFVSTLVADTLTVEGAA